MWMIPAFLLCMQHLLGEHYELHKLVGHLARGRFITKYLLQRILEPFSIQKRHDELAEELLIRSPKPNGHQSPLKPIHLEHLSYEQCRITVNIDKSYRDLMMRCPDCKKRIEQYYTHVNVPLINRILNH